MHLTESEKVPRSHREPCFAVYIYISVWQAYLNEMKRKRFWWFGGDTYVQFAWTLWKRALLCKKCYVSKFKRLGTLHHFCLQVQVTSCKCFHIMSSEESNSLQDNYCHIVWASDSVHVNSNSSRHLNHVAMFPERLFHEWMIHCVRKWFLQLWR